MRTESFLVKIDFIAGWKTDSAEATMVSVSKNFKVLRKSIFIESMEGSLHTVLFSD